MHCKNCGNKLDDNANFCPNCGAEVNLQPKTSAEAAPPEPVAPPPVGPVVVRRKRGFVLSLIALVLLKLHFVCIILSLLAIIFSAEDLSNAKDEKPENQVATGLSITGIILGVAALLIIVVNVFYSGSNKTEVVAVSATANIVTSTPTVAPTEPPVEDAADSIWADEFTPINDFRYTLDKTNNTITLIRYKGDDTKIMLSPVYTIDGVDYDLVSLGDEGCFFGEISITSVYIPEGVTYMSNNCFNSCTALQYLYIPSTMESVTDGFLSYLHDYIVTCDASVELPASRDTNDYREVVDDTTAAEELGESAARAANGFISGFLSGLSEEDEIVVEIFYGGTSEQWNSITD